MFILVLNNQESRAKRRIHQTETPMSAKTHTLHKPIEIVSNVDEGFLFWPLTEYSEKTVELPIEISGIKITVCQIAPISLRIALASHMLEIPSSTLDLPISASHELSNSDIDIIEMSLDLRIARMIEGIMSHAYNSSSCSPRTFGLCATGATNRYHPL